jgi:hypothetical protein
MKEIRWNKSYSQIAKDYDCSVSALKGWSKSGYDLNDSDSVKKLVTKWKVKYGKTSSPSKVSLPPRVLVFNQQSGLNGALERLRQAELELGIAYSNAVKNGSSDAFMLRKEWTDVFEKLRVAEVSNPDVNEANRNSFDKQLVIDTYEKSLVNIRSTLDSIPVRVTKELPEDVKGVIIENIRREINILIEELYALDWLVENE